MKNFIFCLFILPFSCCALTLQESIKLGLNFSPEPRMSTKSLEKAQSNIDVMKSTYWPQLNLIAKSRNEESGASTDYIRSDDESAALTLAAQFTVFDLSRSERMDMARLGYEEEEWSRIASLEKTKFDIAKAYLDIWKQRQERTILENNRVSLGKLLEKIESRYAAGVSQKSDLLRAQVAKDEALSRLSNTLKELQIATVSFAAVSGISVTDKDDFSIPTAKYSELTLTEEDVFQSNPALKMLEKNIAQKRKEYEAIRKEKYPKVQAVANYNERFRKTLSPDATIFIQMSMPLFDGGNTFYRAEGAARDVEVQKLSMLLMRQEMQKNYSTLKASYSMELTSNSELMRNRVKAYDARQQLYLEFPLGLKSIEDMISVERSVADSEIRLLNSHYRLALYYLTFYQLGGRIDTALFTLGEKHGS